MMRVLILFALCSIASAVQIPLTEPQPSNKQWSHVSHTAKKSHFTVAIVGAGAGGSSAAFWINKARERYGLHIDSIDVYERSDYIGGRSTIVYPYNDTTLEPLELGASIFVKANKNLWRATDAFNLTRRDFDDEDGITGIWDGQSMLVTIGGGHFWDSWWTTAKIIWRYGISAPSRTRSLVNTMITQYLELYSVDGPRWKDINSLVSYFGWESMVGQTTADYLDAEGVAPKFSRELVEAATRVNYAQNVDAIHAIEGLCSMAATGAAGVQGGNFQLFEKFLEASGAKVMLNTNVISILPRGDGQAGWTLTSTAGVSTYDAVILASPYHSSSIVVPPAIHDIIPAQPYIHLHVTLFTTSSPSPLAREFSGVQSILTSANGVRSGGPAPEFRSVSYHGEVKPGRWAVKVFSMDKMEDEWLHRNFAGVDWIHRKEWNSYPVLPPTTAFPPVVLAPNLYYVNAFEPFISTMETETISSRNIVDLLLTDKFNVTLCSPELPERLSKKHLDDDFVYGWDC